MLNMKAVCPSCGKTTFTLETVGTNDPEIRIVCDECGAIAGRVSKYSIEEPQYSSTETQDIPNDGEGAQ